MRLEIKSYIAAGIVTLLVSAGAPQARAGSESYDPLSEVSILHDPEVPILGDQKADLTIVEYFDYQCPVCRRFHPELSKIVRDDGHVRLVLKVWPVFGDDSVYAARLALAAGYQSKFAAAHEALFSIKERLSEDNVNGALAQAGVDVERAKRDLATNQRSIDAVLARNQEQALALGFQGTPAFIVGHFRVPGALDPDDFKRAMAEARSVEKNK
jgi:protein-disulfide isomerase